MKTWTKKNVEKMYKDELVKWNNKMVELLEEAKRLDMKIEKTEKAHKIVLAEMKKRKMI